MALDSIMLLNFLTGANSGDKTSAKSFVQLRRSAVEKFLDSENNKSDYEWYYFFEYF